MYSRIKNAPTSDLKPYDARLVPSCFGGAKRGPAKSLEVQETLVAALADAQSRRGQSSPGGGGIHSPKLTWKPI